MLLSRSFSFPSSRLFSRSFSTLFHPIPSTLSPSFPNEYSSPHILTSIPGPKSQSLYKQMDQLQEARTTHFFADYTNSRGNYIVDADSNVLLDVFCQISSVPIGYNNPTLFEAAKSDEWIRATINRPALGIAPGTEWPQQLKDIFMSIAPTGLSHITTLMCGSCANEVAMKAAFMRYKHKYRINTNNGKPEFTAEELTSCMKNQSPGSPNLSILSFKGAFHGRTFGALSVTRSKDLHKVDIPAFNWPVCDFPQLKYPLEDHESENEVEENRCLEQAEEIIKTFPNKVVGLIIEPILAEGGDLSASNRFFRELRKLAKKHDISFIVDEVQTGCGPTGKIWAHEHWGLSKEEHPDIVTFSKKFQSAGFFSTPEYRPTHGYRNFNTWLGDPVKALQTKVIMDTIKQQNLLENTRITGDYMKKHLENMAKKDFPHLLHNVRGMGTFLAYDLPTAALRDELVVLMRNSGIQTSGCGTKTIRLRPMLIFQPKHAAIYLQTLYNNLQIMNKKK